jgi:aspartyl/asparaginyl beta-hydroxylase (cupin superfamily)
MASPADWARQTVRTSMARAFVWIENQISTHSKVDTSPLIPGTQFPWSDILENDWRDIRAELDAIMGHCDAFPNMQDISVEQSGLTHDDKWKTFFFIGFGKRSKQTRELCPKTAALLDGVPGIVTAFFSILGPDKHIPAHRGYYRGLVRYHLAVRVPKDRTSCAIRVGNTVTHWTEGTGFFFDDTYRHEAWNKSSDVRVVLLLDVIRPLSFPYSLVNKTIVYAIAQSPSVRKAKMRGEAWERQFERILSGKQPRNSVRERQ